MSKEILYAKQESIARGLRDIYKQFACFQEAIEDYFPQCLEQFKDVRGRLDAITMNCYQTVPKKCPCCGGMEFVVTTKAILKDVSNPVPHGQREHIATETIYTCTKCRRGLE